MRKLVVFLFVLVVFNGCKTDGSEDYMFSASGIPETDQAFSFMYFKNENVGYLFGTQTTYQDMTEENLNDPEFVPETVDEANIYKTADGGRTWVKIDSLVDYRYQNIAHVLGDLVYIECFHFENKDESKIVIFDIGKDLRTALVDFSTASAIWSDQDRVLVSESRPGDKIYTYSRSMTEVLDTIPVAGYALKGIATGDRHFIVKATQEKTAFVEIGSNGEKEISVPLVPADMVMPHKDKIIIAGNAQEDVNLVRILSYDVKTRKISDVKTFQEYSIVQGLAANKDVIVGFAGNISGTFTSYDMILSLDRGKTWSVKELNEPRYIRPSCLVNNTLFVYSGMGRLQKIPLK